MRNLPKISFFIFFPLLGILFPCLLLAKGLEGTIIRVVDGDSLLVNNRGIEENVRLIGIDAPETQDNPKAEKDAERDSEALSRVLSRGKEAAAFVRNFIHRGDKVRVETDGQQRDPYGRLLGYVYLSGGILLNEQILLAGYAVPLTIEPNDKFRKRFEAAYLSAVKNKRGLWNEAQPKVNFHEKEITDNAPIRRKGKKKRVKPHQGPQMDVSEQKEVSEQSGRGR